MSRSVAWRWTVPVVLAAALPIGSWVQHVRPAPDATTLPVATPAQIATRAAGTHLQPRSGSFVLSTGLGLGDLGTSSGGGGAGLLGLTGGTGQARAWSDGAGRGRIAQISPPQEPDCNRHRPTVRRGPRPGTPSAPGHAPRGVQ